MTKYEMVKYLQSEYKDMKEQLDDAENALRVETDKFERISKSANVQRASDKFYYLFMLLNDIGIVPNESN